jgi:hypothetical protein
MGALRSAEVVVWRRSIAAVLGLAGSLVDGRVHADDEVRACEASFVNAQQLRQKEQLSLARSELATCQQACAAQLADQCTTWKREIDALMPSIVVAARDEAGREIPAVRVLVDGRPVTLAAGAAHEIDPGHHVVRFDHAGTDPVEREVDLRAGDKRVPVEAVLRRKAEPAAPRLRAPAPAREHPPDAAQATVRGATPTAAYVFLGIGGAAVAAAAALSIVGHVERADLVEECGPACAPERADPIRTKWLLGGILAGVGAAALTAGAIVWASAGAERQSSTGGATIALGAGVIRAKGTF